MLNNTFQFKQFAVDQTGCAMKVNTDGVLLGVMAGAETPGRVLDIGAGTGVIALILAQRFPSAKISAVEIDANAAQTASLNFSQSVFSSRLRLYHSSFESFFEFDSQAKFDLIVSNPPFFIDSLRSDNHLKGVARHTNEDFFETLLRDSALHLAADGELALILPVKLSERVRMLALKHALFVQKKVGICSFPHSIPHREIISLGFRKPKPEFNRFVIYSQPKKYSDEYQQILKDFFTIF